VNLFSAQDERRYAHYVDDAKVCVGQVGYQTNLYSGGTEQVVIPAPWDIPGIKTLNFGELK